MTRAIVMQVSTSGGGVPKRAVAEARLQADGLVGDGWDHPNIHGGRKQAALVVTVEGIEELTALGFLLYPGALGENLTTRGLDRRTIRIGQRYRAGEAVLEITKIRCPCSTLDVYGRSIQAAMYDARTQAGDPRSPTWGLSGFYAAVVEPGIVRAGEPIELISE
ncbi:MAG TPA: MOSC domain-containing protein [Vicinamibacterales bacterium]|nr:MOSC domain-containing protein [Vicinamibacterales bacterium]